MSENIDTSENLTSDELALIEAYANKYGIGTGYPKHEEKLGMFQLYNKIIDTPDSTKVANFDNEDLQRVRILQSTAAYSETMGLKNVSNFFKKEAEIIAATSLGHKGKLLDTIITQKRKSETKIGGKEKKGWFADDQKEAD